MSQVHPPDVPGLLRQYGLRPQKSLGQNYLVDPQALQRIVEAAGVQESEAVLEIGAGLGSLTVWLAARARHVVAVEMDRALIAPLQQVLASCPNVTLVQGDILELDPGELVQQATRSPRPSYRVVANIPYYITSALIRRLLEADCPPHNLTLTVQREVAGRICATPPDMSLLAISVQVYGRPQIVARIPAGAFYPPPRVESAVIRVDRFAQPAAPPELLPLFFQLAKAGFSQKRKTLRNALAGGLGWPPERAAALLHAAGLDPQRRAETLSIAEWRLLAETSQRSGPQQQQ